MKTGDCHRADHLLEHALEALLEDAKNPPTPEAAHVRALAPSPPCLRMLPLSAPLLVWQWRAEGPPGVMPAPGSRPRCRRIASVPAALLQLPPPPPGCWLPPQAARDLLARVGELGAEELGAALTQYGVKAPDTKNDISAPFPFNLMFK